MTTTYDGNQPNDGIILIAFLLFFLIISNAKADSNLNNINYTLDEISYKINNTNLNKQTIYNTKKKLNEVLKDLESSDSKIKIEGVFLFDDK